MMLNCVFIFTLLNVRQLDRREPDDPGRYLLAMWAPGKHIIVNNKGPMVFSAYMLTNYIDKYDKNDITGETAESIEHPKVCCNSQDGHLCQDNTCFSCNNIREAQAGIVRCTLLVMLGNDIFVCNTLFLNIRRDNI